MADPISPAEREKILSLVQKILVENEELKKESDFYQKSFTQMKVERDAALELVRVIRKAPPKEYAVLGPDEHMPVPA